METLEFNSIDGQAYIAELMNMTGRKLLTAKGKSLPGLNAAELKLTGIERGRYIVALKLSSAREVGIFMVN